MSVRESARRCKRTPTSGRVVVLATLGLIGVWTPTAVAGDPLRLSAAAYPEYQVFVRNHSGRPINCAMCHAHSDGPDGAAHGQVGSLDSEGLSALALARAAFEPGQVVNSPILNAFGNRMVEDLGRNRILELRARPEELAEALGFERDLDQDGISDGQEYLDGTHPLQAHDGDPWRLFRHNFLVHWRDVALIGIATALTMYGLAHLLRGYGVEWERARQR